MCINPIDDELAVKRLKREFEELNLDLDQVYSDLPGNMQRNRRALEELIRWVRAYSAMGSREKMQAEGFEFPPIEPDCDPETDWMRFELWLRGESIKGETIREYMPFEPGELPSPDAVKTDAQAEALFTKVCEALAEQRMLVNLHDNIPPKLAYAIVWDYLDEEFEVLGPRTRLHLDGCDGYCPGCMQRPWCENGLSCWVEDEEAGHMVVPDKLRQYNPPQIPLEKLEQEF